MSPQRTGKRAGPRTGKRAGPRTGPDAGPRTSPGPERRTGTLAAGTEEHYLDAALYDHEYRRRRADVNYYRALAGGRLGDIVQLPGRAPPPPLDGTVPPEDPDRPDQTTEILELGCGTGRLLVPLVRDGHHVTGLDLSDSMLDRCRERIARLPEAARARATLVRGDFRDFTIAGPNGRGVRRFPLILTPFNAMMHLYTRDDVERFLACVRRHLAPGGTFAFDVMNPDLEWLRRDPDRRWARTRFKDPHDGRTLYYSTNHVYDTSTQMNWIKIYYDEAPREIAPGPQAPKSALPPTVSSRVVRLAQRQFFPQELVDLLHYNGFAVDQRYGGFVREPFYGESQSQVCRCSIRGPRRR